MPPKRYEYGVLQDGGEWRRYTATIMLDGNGSDTSQAVTNLLDMLERQYKTIYSDGATHEVTYNTKGQKVKEVDPDGLTTLFTYNDLGELNYSAIDMDRDGTMDLPTDRLTRHVQYVTTNHLTDISQSLTYVYPEYNSSDSVPVSTLQTSTDGLQSWTIRHGLTNHVHTLYAGDGDRYVTNAAPDGSHSIQHFLHGKLQSVTRKDAGNTIISQVTYTYDAHGRQSTATDLRDGTSSFNHDDADRRIAMTTPPPGTGQPAQTTGYQYDYAGRVTVVSHPDGTSLTNEYEPTGLLSKKAGARTYPVQYGYDAQGRMTNMITWQDHAQDAGRATTRWEYDPMRGFLVRKTYQDTNSFIVYTNTPAGRLHSRTWARGITTTYTTNAAGETIGIDYSDATTPDVTFNLDRLGRQTNIVDGSGSRYLTYDEDGSVLIVTNASGLLAGLKVAYQYDSLGRRTNTVVFTNNAAAAFAHAYTHDAASRLSGVSDGTYSAAYSYLANSSLIDSINYKDGLNTRMTAPRTYDHLGRPRRISATPTSGLGWSFDFGRELGVDNASGPDYVAITNQAVLAGQTNTTTGHLLVGPAEESFTYDADGNLLTNGPWDYTWDGENRLIEMKSDAAVATEAVKWLVFAYDAWNLLAELDGDDNLIRSFLWGIDLSGSMQGAGGVGGLVAVKDSAEDCHFAAYDGNGNVVGLVDATDGSPSADYEYDPFGQRVRCSAAAAQINPFQFSTKYLDAESGFSYYGHRFYNPSTGRWLSRDPIFERGGLNLYGMTGNDPISKIDFNGTDYAIVVTTGKCGVHHRHLYGDDGKGGGFEIDLA